ncbi:hypothetical protein [Streptomyces albogriseolus]|uniref:hypothetical protein n=1 Tax=Streptomyces albogriseolus TaxID=1887 RepID=UPI003460930D
MPRPMAPALLMLAALPAMLWDPPMADRPAVPRPVPPHTRTAEVRLPPGAPAWTHTCVRGDEPTCPQHTAAR